MGHKRIAFIHGELTSVTKSGFGDSTMLVKNTESKSEDMIKEGRYHVPKDSALATQDLLDMPNPPTCIIYPDDYSLLGGMTVINKRGLKIPDDISIVGYDGILLSRLMRPEFTTYVQDAKGIGISAAKKVIEIIENPKPANRKLLLSKVICKKAVQ